MSAALWMVAPAPALIVIPPVDPFARTKQIEPLGTPPTKWEAIDGIVSVMAVAPALTETICLSTLSEVIVPVAVTVVTATACFKATHVDSDGTQMWVTVARVVLNHCHAFCVTGGGSVGAAVPNRVDSTHMPRLGEPGIMLWSDAKSFRSTRFFVIVYWNA